MAKSGNGKHAGRLDAATVAASSDIDAMWSAVEVARRSLFGQVLAKRPAGGITIAEYCKRFSLGRTTAQCQLRRMVEIGTMKQFAVMLPDSRARLTRIFVFIPVRQAGRKK